MKPTRVLSLSLAGNRDNSTAVLWASESGPYGSYNPVTHQTTAAKAATLFGYSAVPGSNTLTNKFRSDKLTLPPNTNPGPDAVKFTVPTIAGGMVFVAGGSANPYYAPGIVTIPPTPGVNCTPTAQGGACSGGLYIFGIN